MRIYFAGSIRGGRKDAILYRELIDFLQGYGDVLTEHVGDQTLTKARGECYDDEYIHARDLDWLKSSDIMVAEVSTPSLGVGYEIATAVYLNKRVVCLYRPRKDRKLSAMIAGNHNLTILEYDDIRKAKQAIAEFLREVGI